MRKSKLCFFNLFLVGKVGGPAHGEFLRGDLLADVGPINCREEFLVKNEAVAGLHFFTEPFLCPTLCIDTLEKKRC